MTVWPTTHGRYRSKVQSHYYTNPNILVPSRDQVLLTSFNKSNCLSYMYVPWKLYASCKKPPWVVTLL